MDLNIGKKLDGRFAIRYTEYKESFHKGGVRCGS